MNPKVSVIVPIYNVEKYIKNTMKSICNQTYHPLEVILVDDGSQDCSVGIATSELQQKSDIVYHVVRQNNSGLGMARNAGVDKASGDWILFMDSDDVLHNSAIERLVHMAITDSCDFVFLDFQKVGLGNEFQSMNYDDGEEVMEGRELQYNFLIRKTPVIVPGTLFNTEWYNRNYLKFESIRFSEDQQFLWKAIVAADRVGHVRATLYNYLTRPNSIMNGSKAEQLKCAYHIFLDLQSELVQNQKTIPEVKQWMLDRWTLGMLRTGTLLLNWEEFRELFVEVEGIRHVKNMHDFPDKKVRIISSILKMSPKLYYKLFHRLGSK